MIHSEGKDNIQALKLKKPILSLSYFQHSHTHARAHTCTSTHTQTQQWNTRHGSTSSCWQPAVMSHPLFKQQMVPFKSYLSPIPTVITGGVKNLQPSWTSVAHWQVAENMERCHGDIVGVYSEERPVNGLGVILAPATYDCLSATDCLQMQVWLLALATASQNSMEELCVCARTHTVMQHILL